MNPRSFLTKLFAAAVLMSGAAATADFSQDGEHPWNKMGDSVVTPHRKFYKPLSGRKPKIFFIGYKLGMREITEFRQRFDCDYQYWPASNFKTFSAFEPKPVKVYAPTMDDKTYAAERKRIFAHLADSDVIMLGKVHFANVPADLQKKMLDRVQAGASLVLVIYNDELPKIKGANFQSMPLPKNIPAAAIPDLKGTKLLASNFGAGKIVVVDYDECKQAGRLIENLVPYESCDPLYYEYNYAFLGALVRELTAKDLPVITADKSGAVITGKLPAGAKVRVDYLDRFGKVKHSETYAAKTGKVYFQVPPSLPASVKMQDLFLLDAQGKVLNFASAPCPTFRTNLISSVKMDSDVCGQDRKFSGVITMQGKPNGTLKFEAVDNKGRVIYLNVMKAAAGANKFAFTVAPFDSYSAKLNIQYFENKEMADEQETSIYFPIDRAAVQNDFQFAIWANCVSHSPVTRFTVEQMKKAGIDIIMDAEIMYYRDLAGLPPRLFHDNGIAYAIYLTRLVGEYKYQPLCNFSLADAVRDNKSYFGKNGKPFASNYNSIEKIVKEASKFGVAYYNLGDENSVSAHAIKEFCLCKECEVRFRKFLKETYGTIEKVNAQYGSKFKDFSQIKTLPLDEAAEKELLSMWLDFRSFMDYSFTDWHKMLVDQIRRHDKTSAIGIEGLVYPAKSYSGFNLPHMLPNFDFCAPYFIARDIKALKYMKENSFKSAWYGTYEGEMSEQWVRQPPWRYLFGGLHGAFWWYAGYPGYSNASIYRMDLGFLQQFTQSADEIAKMKKSGIAKLIMDSKLRDDGVAVHYSQACLHAANLNPDKTTWELSINNIVELLQSMGIGFEYLTPAEILAGKLKNVKVLYLPYSQAMSKEEAAVMRQFVKNGGLLIADYNPGIMDEHGKFLDDSLLADVFGPMDKLNVKKYGKGHAVILYDYLDGAAQRAQKGTAAGIQRGLFNMFSKYAGVKPVATALDSYGYPAEYTPYTNGKDQYLCFLGPITEAGEAKKSTAGAESGASGVVVSSGNTARTVILPAAAHVYDVSKGKYLGKVKEFKFELDPAVGRVFAVTAEKAPVPVIAGPAAMTYAKPADFKLSNVPNPCHVTITAPDGKTVLEMNIKANGTFRFVPSFDMPEGDYKVEVKNVISGAVKTMKTTLK